MLALFRIIEPVSGTILIDSVDITEVGLHDCKLLSSNTVIASNQFKKLVRSGLSIVPQSPDLFEGTLRENIDPVGEYSDINIWIALEQVSKAFSYNFAFNLYYFRLI